jgi:hypothetical protein
VVGGHDDQRLLQVNHFKCDLKPFKITNLRCKAGSH